MTIPVAMAMPPGTEPIEAEEPAPARAPRFNLSSAFSGLKLRRTRAEVVADGSEAAPIAGEGTPPDAEPAPVGRRFDWSRLPLANARRETRVGVAALASFLILVAALLLNRRSKESDADKPSAIGTVAALGNPDATGPAPDDGPAKPDDTKSPPDKGGPKKDEGTKSDKGEVKPPKEPTRDPTPPPSPAGPPPSRGAAEPPPGPPAIPELPTSDPHPKVAEAVDPTPPAGLAPPTMKTAEVATAPPGPKADTPKVEEPTSLPMIPPAATAAKDDLPIPGLPAMPEGANPAPIPPVAKDEPKPASVAAPPPVEAAPKLADPAPGGITDLPTILPADPPPVAAADAPKSPASKPEPVPAANAPAPVSDPAPMPGHVMAGPIPTADPTPLPGGTDPFASNPAPSPAPAPAPAPVVAPAPEPAPAARPIEPAAPVATGPSPTPAGRVPSFEEPPVDRAPADAAAGVGAAGAMAGMRRVQNLGKRRAAEPAPDPALAAPPRRVADAPLPREEAGARDEPDPILHTVEPEENFWTISRQYYGSGRYYKALHAANRRVVPDIRELYVGTTIKVPAVESLDPALVDPPSRSRSTDAAATRAGRTAPAPAPRRSDDARPVPSRTRAEVERGASRSRRRGDDADEATRPTYRVRANDTLRSIARETLGDSHRAREILELNRDAIDDPSRLDVGTVLVLPEDAAVRDR